VGAHRYGESGVRIGSQTVPVAMVVAAALVTLSAVAYGAGAMSRARNHDLLAIPEALGAVGTAMAALGLWLGNRLAAVAVLAYCGVSVTLNIWGTFVHEPGRAPLTVGVDVLLLVLLLTPRRSRAHVGLARS
jgi:hypothetical protein